MVSAFTDFGTGSCVNCGFLSSLQLGRGGDVFAEVTISERGNGDMQSGYLHCFVRAANLHGEAKELGEPPVGAGNYAAGVMRTVIEKGRQCERWYPWQEGFTPKEHLEERRALETEDRRRTWEREREDERREWEKVQQGERRKFDIALGAVVAILALAEIIATVIGLL